MDPESCKKIESEPTIDQNQSSDKNIPAVDPKCIKIETSQSSTILINSKTSSPSSSTSNHTKQYGAINGGVNPFLSANNCAIPPPPGFPIPLFNPLIPPPSIPPRPPPNGATLPFIPNVMSFPNLALNPFLPPPPIYPPTLLTNGGVGFTVSPTPWPLNVPPIVVPPVPPPPPPPTANLLPPIPPSLPSLCPFSTNPFLRFNLSQSNNSVNDSSRLKFQSSPSIHHKNNEKSDTFKPKIKNENEMNNKTNVNISPPIKSTDFDRKKIINTSRFTDSNKSLQPQQQSQPLQERIYLSKNQIKEILEDLLTKPIKFKKSTPLEPYYQKSSSNDTNFEIIESTEKSIELREKFKKDILERAERIRSSKPAFSFPKRRIKLRAHKHHHDECGISCSDSSDFDSDFDSDSSDENENTSLNELERKKSHPYRLHPELWYNEPGEMNDGLLCRCSLKAQRSGIRHGIYLGEEHLPKCDPNTNNRHRLYHYVISLNPKKNFLVDTPTTIEHDGQIYYFEGYSMFSHFPIPSSFPCCKIIRYNIEYSISFLEDDFPENFCIGDLDYFFDYIFYELLELVDFNLKAKHDDNGCNRFHFMPRFARLLPNQNGDNDGNGKELLSMSLVLEYLYENSKILIDKDLLSKYLKMETPEWNNFAKQHKGFIVTCPGMKPCSLRVDQIDREKEDRDLKNSSDIKRKKYSFKKSNEENHSNNGDNNNNNDDDDDDDDKYPVIVHFGIRPPQLSYAGNIKYQKAWRDYVKYRHLLANKEKVTYNDRQTLKEKEKKLQEMRSKSDLKRDVTIVVNSKNFYRTGLQCDLVQYSLIIPVLVSHLRFHYSLQNLEKSINYTFKNRSLLQLSLTHPSYRENFGTNPDHARNILTNCGLRFLEYGDRKVHFMNTRKRGINMLINIMSRFGCNEETISQINHNERLEFLGDAVVEFLTSIHLYFLFPDLEEGGLATYRAALVQNQHLAVLARKLQLEKFMLYAHGSDLCHDLELRHAMANCFEAFMGALFLDGGIEIADQIFSQTLFDGQDPESKALHQIWVNYPVHPLQAQFPDGDRRLIESIPRLKELAKFEQITGIEFKHIRLLARAFTHRSVGYNELTLGSNQRMEFLGDTVLQLIASEYLYKHYPEHHEGHLSLLRSSLVNNKTQSVVCDDLGIVDMTQYNSIKSELKTKDRADLLEAFIGALYVDKRIEYCRKFCEVCFFPRLEQFIMNQDWNDPKSKLQQCCLTLRTVDCGEPDIPTYKVIDSKGPTNTRIYEVAVYFRDDRLATGKGHSIQEAEMNAATNALRYSKELFPHLSLQKKVIQRNIRTYRDRDYDDSSSSS